MSCECPNRPYAHYVKCPLVSRAGYATTCDRCGALLSGHTGERGTCHSCINIAKAIESSDCDPCNQTFADDVCPRCAGDMAAEDAQANPNALRYNTGKIDYTLVPLDALEAEARVWMAGEAKYGRLNWRKYWADKTYEVVLASLLRHVYAVSRGELRDPESGEYHMAHVRANAAMLICYEEDKNNVPII